MSRQWKKPVGWTVCGLGCLVTLTGIWAIAGYIWGVVSVLNEPDKSWIFWGLAIFFIGLIGLGLGIGMIVAGWSLVKRG